MFNYVVDTNIVMSMLISGKSHYLKLLSYYNFVFPQYLLFELDEYNELIIEKTKLDFNQLQEFTFKLFSSLTVVPSIVITQQSFEIANKLCERIDIKDISFVALSIETGFPLMTRDIPLYEGLRKQNYRQVILFENFINDLYKMN